MQNRIKIQKNNFTVSIFDIKYKIDLIHPLLEIKRGQLMEKLFEKFYSILKNYINEKNFSFKHKSFRRVCDEIFAKFVINCLSKDNKIDPLIPTIVTDKNLNSLKIDVMVKIKRDDNIKKENRENILEKIMDELNIKNNFKLIYDELYNYYQSNEFNGDKNDTNVEKSTNDKYTSLNYKNEIIDIYPKLYDKILDRFSKNFNGNKNLYIWCVIKRYIILKSYNNQLAVHKKTMEFIRKNYGVEFELFGSVLNTTNRYYCSMFYDIEKHFGSMGSFFDIKLINGSFSMNPPFDVDLMTDAMKKIEDSIRDTDKLNVFIWIPIWDKDGKKWTFENCGSNLKNTLKFYDYGEYKPMTIINKSKHTKFIKKICRLDMTYFDYMYFKKKWVADTYLIVMSNDKFDYELLENYNYKI